MLARENRLTKQKDFDYVFNFGRGAFDQILGLKFVANQLKLNRFGILVSNKISKKAVERNKIKRQARALIRQITPHIKNNYDIVVITLPAIRGTDYNQIEKSLIYCFKKAGLWSNS